MKSLSRGSLLINVLITTGECLKDILKVRDRLQRLTQQLGGKYRLVPLTPPRHRQGKNRQGMRAQSGSVAHLIMAWVAVYSSELGTAYGVTFGDGHPDNLHLVSHVPFSKLEAEYKAVCGALKAVPRDLPVSITCCSAQGHTDMAFNLGG